MADAEERNATFSVSGIDHCERAVERSVGESGREGRSESVFRRDIKAKRVGGRSGEDGG